MLHMLLSLIVVALLHVCRAAFLQLHSAVGRSNDLRALRTCDMEAEDLTWLGPCPAKGLSLDLYGTKTVQVSAEHAG